MTQVNQSNVLAFKPMRTFGLILLPGNTTELSLTREGKIQWHFREPNFTWTESNFPYQAGWDAAVSIGNLIDAENELFVAVEKELERLRHPETPSTDPLPSADQFSRDPSEPQLVYDGTFPEVRIIGNSTEVTFKETGEISWREREYQVEWSPSDIPLDVGREAYVSLKNLVNVVRFIRDRLSE